MLTRTPRGSSGKSHLLARGVMLWRCIADDFEQTILIGKHENGTRLPPESEIAARYGVNRHTVRRAMAELGARGLVRTERGSGFCVQGSEREHTRQPREDEHPFQDPAECAGAGNAKNSG